MLKRVLGALLCVVGLVVAGLAVASATVWRAPDTLTASATSGVPLVVTEPGVLDLAADEVTVRAEADGTAVVIALGRTVDVEGWVGESPATTVTGLADRTTLATTEEPDGTGAPQPGTTPTAPSPEAPEEGAAEEGAAEEPAPAEGAPEEGAPQEAAPDPRGSDLWVEEVSGEGSAELRWDAEDGRWSVLVASVDPAVPPTVTLSWPQTVTTPWLVPGLVVGGLLLLGGAALLLLAMKRPRAGGAGPTAAPAASGPAAATAATTAAVAAPDAGRPLTRRELRELQARGAAPTPRVGPATPPPGDLPPGVPPAPVPGVPPAPVPGDAGVPGRGGQVPGRGPAARPGTPGGDVPPEGASSDGASADGGSPEGTPRDVAARPEGRGGRLLPPAAGRLGPRRTDTAAPRPEASGSPATGDAGGTPPAGPPAGRPSPGASAWRQTWGLPAGDTTAGDTTAGDTTAGGPGPRPGPDASDPAPRTAEAEPDGSTSDDGGAR